ncbi:LamG domain-containing protein [Blastopirellula sp. JC732]|uniref:LamG domain-containing protein n=1 Tax=Blastopirellula sediminis TaxID=2894196 RepID=A0A9X1MN33_9BACT|nr:LamG domain-containing protein [Blastopirellula sediminis]MCC9607126.1 LamG domain-containing protein [Blastopirellula sediminis]MCC9629581.1 LamG domain-containing protein [Blastopirellula sediminis]
MQPNSRQLDNEALAAAARLASGDLSAAEFAALEQRLLTDDAFRQAYVEQVDLDGEIERHLSSIPVDWPSPPQTPRYVWLGALALAASLLLITTMLALVLLREDRVASTAPQLEYVEAQLRGLRAVAVATQLEGELTTADESIQVGARVKPGSLRIGAGALQIEFLSGVIVRLSGPAEMHLLTPDSATLIYGSAAAVVPPDAGDFTLNGPVSAIAASGSEFAYSAPDAHAATIDVYEGEVMTSLLGESGDTLLNELVKADQTARFADKSIEVTAASFAQSDRVRVLPIDEMSLSVTDEYAAAILADRPLVYWRFEPQQQQGDLVRNVVSDRYAGLVRSDDDSVKVERGSLHFEPSPRSRYFKLTEPLADLNAGDFTLEMWVRPNRMHWGTILGLLPDGQMAVNRERHLAVLEYANHTNLVHRPATMRFLYRYPSNSYDGGMNVFSAESCTPGLWHHLVAVKSAEGIALYLNGKLRQVFDTLTIKDEEPYTAVLGQLDTLRPSRQFDGQLDEVAIYPAALSTADVERHYQIMTGASSRQ